MGKIGIGQEGSDLNPSIKERGTEVTQVVEIVDANGNQVTSFGVSTSTAGTVANIGMPLANTEYSYTFPSGTVKFRMKLRSQSAKFKYSYTSGQSGTTYITIPQNFMYGEESMNFGGVTIYFQSDRTSQIMEITSYQ